jgi:hypothetical protein
LFTGAALGSRSSALKDLDHEQPGKPGPVDRVEEEEAIRPKHACDPVDHGIQVVDVFEHVAAGSQVEARVWEGERLTAPLLVANR